MGVGFYYVDEELNDLIVATMGRHDQSSESHVILGYGSAPLSSNIATIGAWPTIDAYIKAVSESWLSCVLTSDP